MGKNRAAQRDALHCPAMYYWNWYLTVAPNV